MNYELFIVKRLLQAKKYKSSVSAPIIKIGMIAIALGVIVMLIAIATGLGLQKKIREKISGFNGHIQIVNYDFNASMVSVKPVSTQQDFYPEFTDIKGIKNVQVFAQKAGILKTETDFEGVILKGVGSDYDWTFFEEYITKGKLPKYSDTLSNDIMISKYLADALHLDIGDDARIWFVRENLNKAPKVRKFSIQAIYDSGFQEFDETYLFCDIKQIQKLNKWQEDEVGGFEVLLNDFDELNDKNVEIHTEIPPTLQAISILQKYPAIFEWVSLFDSNIIVIIGIMILVAGFNMITALLVLILEQTRMIGILKAMGSRNWDIRKIFLYQATYLIFKGLLWGNLIGLTLLFIQKYGHVIKLNPETYYVTEAPVYINITYILLLNIGVIILSYLMLLIPSYYITKISPVKSIKFE